MRPHCIASGRDGAQATVCTAAQCAVRRPRIGVASTEHAPRAHVDARTTYFNGCFSNQRSRTGKQGYGSSPQRATCCAMSRLASSSAWGPPRTCA
ncbi:hypothetical protein XabCFBP2524_21775 [Xanthomonas axonopodis pv. begoniae]|nr:hypothetical protein XabCFBP2524_21775 [Xanthomonas axonopodis pv. begoniae]